MLYGLGPGCSDFDEDVVLKDLLGFAVDLSIGAEDVKLVAITSTAVAEAAVAFGAGGAQNLPVDLLTDLRRAQ